MKTLPSDPFLRGYIVAALFTTDPCPPGGCDYQDSGRAEDMMPRVPDTFLEEAKRDCAAFVAKNEADLDAAREQGRDFEKLGTDLWFSRNGHGTGFWDRDLGDVGDRLHKAAKAMGEHDLTLGGWWRVEYRCPKCHAEWTHDEDAEAEDFGESQCEECEIPVLSLNREQGEHLTDIEEPEAGEGSDVVPFASAHACELFDASEKVLANWDSGDLAGAVRELAAVVETIRAEASRRPNLPTS